MVYISVFVLILFNVIKHVSHYQEQYEDNDDDDNDDDDYGDDDDDDDDNDDDNICALAVTISKLSRLQQRINDS